MGKKLQRRPTIQIEMGESFDDDQKKPNGEMSPA